MWNVFVGVGICVCGIIGLALLIAGEITARRKAKVRIQSIEDLFETEEEFREYELEVIGKLLQQEQFAHVLERIPTYTGDKRVDDKLYEEYNEYLNTEFVGELFMVGEWLHRENVNRYLR